MVAVILVIVIIVFEERLILMNYSLVRIILRSKIIRFSHRCEAHINKAHCKALYLADVETGIWLLANLHLLINQDLF